MRGRKLTVEEVLKMDGQKIWVEWDNPEWYGEMGEHTVEITKPKNISSYRIFYPRVTGVKDGMWININSDGLRFYENVDERIYKTSEMIAMLEENQELRFIANNGEDGEGICCIVDNEIVIKGEEPVLYLDDRWQLIEEPKEVTFIEAVKAFGDGNTIKSKLKFEHIYNNNDSYTLDDENGNAVSTEEILEGRWFIL